MCTTSLKSRSDDVDRALAVCAALVGDDDDMVEKGLSWALRVQSTQDPLAVAAFLDDHGEALAARVRREEENKLRTGLKNPRGGQL